MRISRRQLMESLGIAAVASGVRAVADDAGGLHGKKSEQCPLALSEFQPKSMLHVSQTRVERARFLVIDFHTHLSWISGDHHGVSVGEEMTYLAPPAELLSVMDRRNLRTMVNLTGGWGRGLEQTVEKYQKAEPAPTPPQGRWCIYGLGLPEDILGKIYYENAARLLGIELKV